MADGRHLGKIEKSSYLRNGLIDFDEIWHGKQFDPVEPSDRYKFEILKIQDGGGRHLVKNRKIAISRPRYDRFRGNFAR